MIISDVYKICAVILCHAIFGFHLARAFVGDNNDVFHADTADSDPADRLIRSSTSNNTACPPPTNTLLSSSAWSIFSRIVSPLTFCRNAAGCKENQVCCPYGRQKICMKPSVIVSVPHQRNNTKHKPFFGFSRYCPTTEPLQEILPVRNCTNDNECEPPRICCPDGGVSYCRTPSPHLESRNSRALIRVIKNLVSYMQCTPPPPPLLDLFPKTCKYYIDCFPNLCCQEKDHKVCRPPKRSILRLLALPTN